MPIWVLALVVLVLFMGYLAWLDLTHEHLTREVMKVVDESPTALVEVRLVDRDDILLEVRVADGPFVCLDLRGVAAVRKFDQLKTVATNAKFSSAESAHQALASGEWTQRDEP